MLKPEKYNFIFH